MILALLSPLFLFLAQATPAQTDAGPARLELAEVKVPLPDGTTATAERGFLRVPIVRADPKSKVIGIDVWRFRARADAAPGAPPVFQLNGGPGWPGLEPEGIDWERDIAPIVKSSDLVIVGQRGIGSSSDTGCAAVVTGLARPGLNAPLAEKARYLREACAACRAHWEAQGYDLSGLTVKEAAADVDDVRRLLGYPKIVLLGGSFGSHWSMAVLRFHSDGVARALLDGLEGPDQTYDLPSGVLHSLERVAAAAERAPELSEHIPEGGLLAALRAVIEGVAEEPFEVEVPDPRTGRPTAVRFDATTVRELALGYSGRASSRAGLASWPADVIALARGEFEPAARARLADGDGLELPTASFFMLDCGSGITPERRARLASDPAAALVGDLGWWYASACPAWDADLGDAFRTGFRTRVPTVIVQGTWDMNTPFDNALELVPAFEALTFVPVEGGSHNALDEAMRDVPGFGEAVLRFLATGETAGFPREVALPDLRWNVPR